MTVSSLAMPITICIVEDDFDLALQAGGDLPAWAERRSVPRRKLYLLQ